MSSRDPGDGGGRAYLPLVVLSGVVVLAAVGFAGDVRLSNLHNGVLALAFGAIGAYVWIERPGHRLGRLFLATASVHAVMFAGRQVGHAGAASGAERWWAWFGVWPVAAAIALTTMAVLCFPDGRLPSARWRPVVWAIAMVATICSALSALWPVEYAQVGLTTPHPLNAEAPAAISAVWAAIARPAYVGFQALWVIAVVVRWRRAGAIARAQLAVLGAAAAASIVALLTGLALWGTPRPGILAAALVPLAAGWAVVHGRRLARYTALSWLARAGSGDGDLPNGLARAAAQGLQAKAATLWIGADQVHAVGVWPDTDELAAPTTLDVLQEAPDRHVRSITNGTQVIGALSVARARADQLSLSEQCLFDDLAAHGRFVIEHIGLGALAATLDRARHDGLLAGFTPRERDVLELMARGLSNSAICGELHLSIKTVEPVVSSIFGKLGLHADSATNRRVLAVVTHLRAERG
ncbi:MAG: LuxR C-terminal-related transcriptional regulator [Acidimicrobiales bacterium]